MTCKHLVLTIMSLIWFSLPVTAQEVDALLTIVLDETVTIELEPDAHVTYTLEPDTTQNLLIQTDSDFAHTVSVEDGDGNSIFVQDIDSDDNRFVGRIVPVNAESDISQEPSYTIQITNTDENTGDVTLSVAGIEAHKIEVGDTYPFEADQPPIMELLFTGEADQQITIEASSPQIRYAIEYVDDDGYVNSLLWNSISLHPATGIQLENDGEYRVVVQFVNQPEDAPLTDPQIGIFETGDFVGEISVGGTSEGIAPPAHFQFSLPLEALQGVRVTFESDGAQTYITDADETILAFSGHGAIPREVTQMDMIAPITGTYTIYAYNPEMGDLFAGNFTLSVEPIEIPVLTDEPMRLALTRSSSQLILADVQPGTSYQLTFENPDEAEGGVRVRVYELNGETLLQDESAKDISATYTFAVEDVQAVGVELTLLNAPEATVDVNLQPLDGN